MLLPKFLKSAYRQEPISSFIVIVGATDFVMGGIGGQWPLFSLGLIMVFTAGVIRWQKTTKPKSFNQQKQARYILPPSSSRPPLPTLINQKTYK